MTYKSDSKANQLKYTQGVDADNSASIFFENLPDLISLRLVSKILNRSVATLYDWNYRGKTRKSKIPPDLFAKLGGGLYVRKDILVKWMSNRCSSY